MGREDGEGGTTVLPNSDLSSAATHRGRELVVKDVEST